VREKKSGYFSLAIGGRVWIRPELGTVVSAEIARTYIGGPGRRPKPLWRNDLRLHHFGLYNREAIAAIIYAGFFAAINKIPNVESVRLIIIERDKDLYFGLNIETGALLTLASDIHSSSSSIGSSRPKTESWHIWQSKEI